MTAQTALFLLSFLMSITLGFLNHEFWQSILLTVAITYSGYVISGVTQLYDFWKTRGVGFLINIAIGQFFMFGIFNSIFYWVGSLAKYLLDLI